MCPSAAAAATMVRRKRSASSSVWETGWKREVSGRLSADCATALRLVPRSGSAEPRVPSSRCPLAPAGSDSLVGQPADDGEAAELDQIAGQLALLAPLKKKTRQADQAVSGQARMLHGEVLGLLQEPIGRMPVTWVTPSSTGRPTPPDQAGPECDRVGRWLLRPHPKASGNPPWGPPVNL